MADDVKITNFPDPSPGSRFRVAFDLMEKVMSQEHGYGAAGPENPRKYILDLYAECIRVVGR